MKSVVLLVLALPFVTVGALAQLVFRMVGVGFSVGDDIIQWIID